MIGQQPRRCRECGALLSAANNGPRCAPCSRAAEATSWQPPAVAPEFWERKEVADALSGHHIGHVFRAYRRAHEPAINQADLAHWLGLTQPQISRIESAARPPAHSIERLSRWATQLGIPRQLLWFVPAHTGGAYENAVTAPNLSASETVGDDVRRRQFLKTTVGASLLAGTSAAAVSHQPDVRRPAVEIRNMTARMRQIDNQFGGGRGRSVVTAYLSTVVEPQLHDARDANRADMFTAAAEMQHLAGWMAYDVGQPTAGARHLRAALKLSQEAGADAYAAELFAAMSHQAAFHRSADAALDLATAARHTARNTEHPALRSEASALEAHAYALKNDKPQAFRALRDAESEFAAAVGRDVPEWLAYFDHAYLAAKFGHTFRELGMPHEAETFARRSLEMSDGYNRGRLFNLSLLASTLADQRCVEEACQAAETALHMTESVRSIRSNAYLTDVGRRLAPFRTAPVVQDLMSQMADAGLPA